MLWHSFVLAIVDVLAVSNLTLAELAESLTLLASTRRIISFNLADSFEQHRLSFAPARFRSFFYEGQL